MKHCILTLVLLFIILSSVLSQSDFRKGYIVSSNNDTTFGLIDYKGDKANSKFCLFKHETGAEESKFTPAQISSYRFIDSKYYVSKVLKTDVGEDTLFLEYLINGIVDFYYYRDINGEHYLVDNGDGKLLALKNEQKEFKVDEITYARNAKEYVGVLKYAFMKSPSVCKEVETVSLGHNSLIKIANEYHNEVCTDKECIIYEKKLPKVKIAVGPLAGINFISISKKDYSYTTVITDDYYYIDKSNFDVDIFPSIGFYAKVNMPYVNERLFFQYEGTYSKHSMSTTNIFSQKYLDSDFKNDITITQYAFNNSAMFMYEFPFVKFRPSILAGLFFNYYLKTDYLRTEDYRIMDYKYKDEWHYYHNQYTDYPFLKFDRGLSFGLGLTYKVGKRAINMDVKYQRGFGIIRYLSSNTFSVNLSLQIGK